MTLTKVDTAKLAVVQMSMSDSLEENVTKAERFVREAAAQGANIVLLPELFEISVDSLCDHLYPVESD